MSFTDLVSRLRTRIQCSAKRWKISSAEPRNEPLTPALPSPSMPASSDAQAPALEPRERGVAAAGDIGPAVARFSAAMAAVDQALDEINAERAAKPCARVVLMPPRDVPILKRHDARIYVWPLSRDTWLDDCARWREKGYRLRQRRLGVLEAVRL